MKTIASLLLGSLVAFGASGQAQAKDMTPSDDAQVLERLAPRVRSVKTSAATNASEAAQLAQQAIRLARQTADPRHLGRAQALLQPWWSRTDAPAPIAVLQATVEQSQHEFAAARKSLARATALEPRNAQAWITLASLERLEGRYAQARNACSEVAKAGHMFYAKACQLEMDSLTGQHATARAGFAALLRQAPSAADSAWLYLLIAESEERAGQNAAAQRAYQLSLAHDPAPYTAVALADMQLRQQQPQAALNSLAKSPSSDAVLLRRAQALRQLNNPQWKNLRHELRDRFEAAGQRGDSPLLHARELAQAALLDDQAAQALAYALENLRVQKEPLDWLLALQAATRAGNAKQLAALHQQVQATGLRDARLAPQLFSVEMRGVV